MAFGQAHELRVLRRHIDRHESGKALHRVGDPLDGIGVHERRDAVRRVLVVDLRVRIVALVDAELADEVAHLADGPAAQTYGRPLVDHGHAVHGNLADVFGEVTIFDLHKRRVRTRVEERRACHVADNQPQNQHKDEHDDPEDEPVLLLLALGALAVAALARRLLPHVACALSRARRRTATAAEQSRQRAEEALATQRVAEIRNELRSGVMQARQPEAHADDDEAPDDEPPEVDAFDVDGRNRDVVEDSDHHDRDNRRDYKSRFDVHSSSFRMYRAKLRATSRQSDVCARPRSAAATCSKSPRSGYLPPCHFPAPWR